MPKVKHIYIGGKIHLKNGKQTACGIDLNLALNHGKMVKRDLDCERCIKFEKQAQSLKDNN